MSPKKISKKKAKALQKVKSLISKEIDLDKIKVNSINLIEDTKNKLGNLGNINNVIRTIIDSEYINGSTIDVDGGI